MKKRVLFIVAQKDFRDDELLVPRKVLETAGIEVITASITTETAFGTLGLKIRPEIAVKDTNIADYDMVVMVGGPGARKLIDYEEVHNLFLQARATSKAFGAICIAPMILANIGVLEDKKATVYNDPDAISSLEEGGAKYTGNDVEVDGNIITANGPHSAEKFGQAIVTLLHNTIKKTTGKK